MLHFFIEKYSFESDHIILWLLVIVVFVLWVFSAAYIANTKAEDPSRKICWLLIVLFFGPLGSLLYVICGREKDVTDENKDAYEKWIQADPSRAYMNKEDRLEAFENYQKQT